jgi:hypothetical protein
MKRISIFLSGLIIISGLLVSCASPVGTISSSSTPDSIGTFAEATLLVQESQSRASEVLPSNTPTPGETSTTLPSASPSSTLPVSTPSQPPPTFTPTLDVNCDQALLLGEVTAAAGSQFLPGEAFHKTWRLMNIGDCIWNGEYALVFIEGESMQPQLAIESSEVVYLSTTVLPGDVVDITLKLTAPMQPGKYTGQWKLRSDKGKLFGPRDDTAHSDAAHSDAAHSADAAQRATNALWVTIEVFTPEEGFPSNMVYNFLEGFCAADWSSGKETPLCSAPGNWFETGAVYRLMSSLFEGGHAENEAVIVTIPSNGQKGMISGHYPPIEIKEGYHFESWIGCLEEALYCDVTFRLDASVNGAPPQTLGSWVQVNDGEYEQISVNLDAFAGKSVAFTLTVLNNGDSQDDKAFWLVPAIFN